jgi:putative protein kinase ArgK-like GTPase of G3E family
MNGCGSHDGCVSHDGRQSSRVNSKHGPKTRLSLSPTIVMSLRPLIVIVGTTGVGKSNLAIELALHLARTRNIKPKVINADAMQVYAGIDIITNKVPMEEQRGVEHLLMGFRQPGEQYVVGHWVRDAMKLVCTFTLFRTLPGLTTMLSRP